VIYAGETPAARGHQLLSIRLADGRRVRASPGHPTQDHEPLARLALGDVLDNSVVTQIDLVTLEGDATFDVLPSGPTGLYWVDGVLLESSLAEGN
jgi:hypothetical protein